MGVVRELTAAVPERRRVSYDDDSISLLFADANVMYFFVCFDFVLLFTHVLRAWRMSGRNAKAHICPGRKF